MLLTAVAFAGHAGELDTPGVMPHELVAGLVGLAAILLLALKIGRASCRERV